MAASRDTTRLGCDADQLLGQYVAARDAGDTDAARAAWYQLVALSLPRVEGLVRATSHKHLSAEEQNDAISHALEKLLTNMFRTFRGTSMGEFHNSAKRLVYGVCVDTQRRAKTISKHTAPLHATGDNGEFTDGFTPSVNKAAAREHDARDADERDADNIADLAAVFDQALATMTPANRSVMELQRDGLTTDEICEKLNMSPEAVYQNTSRGTKAILKFAEAQNA